MISSATPFHHLIGKEWRRKSPTSAFRTRKRCSRTFCFTSHGCSGWLTPAPSDFLRHSFPPSNSRPKIARKRASLYAPRMSNVAFGTRKSSLCSSRSLTSHGCSGWLTPAPSDFLRHSFPPSNSRPKIARKRASPSLLLRVPKAVKAVWGRTGRFSFGRFWVSN